MNDDERISVREFIERILVEHEKRYDQRFAEQERALALQAREYERRLQALNHSHEQAREKEASYVTLDKYEDFVSANRVERDGLLARLEEHSETLYIRISALENWRSRAMGAGVVVTILAGGVGAGISRLFGH